MSLQCCSPHRIIITLVYMVDWLLYAAYIRHKGKYKHQPIWTCLQSHRGLMASGWGSVLPRSVRFSLVLCFSIWLLMCSKCKQPSLCDVWIADDNPLLWMRSTQSNLLCFLCAPQVHFLSSTIQTRKLTAFFPPVSLLYSSTHLSHQLSRFLLFLS